MLAIGTSYRSAKFNTRWFCQGTQHDPFCKRCTEIRMVLAACKWAGIQVRGSQERQIWIPGKCFQFGEIAWVTGSTTELTSLYLSLPLEATQTTPPTAFMTTQYLISITLLQESWMTIRIMDRSTIPHSLRTGTNGLQPRTPVIRLAVIQEVDTNLTTYLSEEFSLLTTRILR